MSERPEAPRLQKRSAEQYLTTRWSGGTTTQIAIWPPEARYADQDFLWRISSATVELETSEFTPLPDYARQIATLEGRIVLTHNGGAPIALAPFEVHAFSGGDVTTSAGRCRDFNLMLRRGRVQGRMEALALTEPSRRPLLCKEGEQLLVYCVSGLCVCKGPSEQAEVSLKAAESLLLTGSGTLSLSGPARLMVCRIQLFPEEEEGASAL